MVRLYSYTEHTVDLRTSEDLESNLNVRLSTH
jgi:hypothetical protein